MINSNYCMFIIFSPESDGCIRTSSFAQLYKGLISALSLLNNSVKLLGKGSTHTQETDTCIFLCVCMLSCSVMSDSLRPDCSRPGSSVQGILQARILEWLLFPPPGDCPDSGIKPASLSLLHWQAGSLPLEPPGKSQVHFSPVLSKSLVK